jgi:hypothetical protein
VTLDMGTAAYLALRRNPVRGLKSGYAEADS